MLSVIISGEHDVLKNAVTKDPWYVMMLLVDMAMALLDIEAFGANKCNSLGVLIIRPSIKQVILLATQLNG